jgi:hypothetical protein
MDPRQFTPSPRSVFIDHFTPGPQLFPTGPRDPRSFTPLPPLLGSSPAPGTRLDHRQSALVTRFNAILSRRKRTSEAQQIFGQLGMDQLLAMLEGGGGSSLGAGEGDITELLETLKEMIREEGIGDFSDDDIISELFGKQSSQFGRERKTSIMEPDSEFIHDHDVQSRDQHPAPAGAPDGP